MARVWWQRDGGEIAERFTVVIAAEGIDRQGVLEDIIAALSHKLALNIRSMSINARQEVFHCEVTVQVDSTAMADRICQALKRHQGNQIGTANLMKYLKRNC